MRGAQTLPRNKVVLGLVNRYATSPSLPRSPDLRKTISERELRAMRERYDDYAREVAGYECMKEIADFEKRIGIKEGKSQDLPVPVCDFDKSHYEVLLKKDGEDPQSLPETERTARHARKRRPFVNKSVLEKNETIPLHSQVDRARNEVYRMKLEARLKELDEKEAKEKKSKTRVLSEAVRHKFLENRMVLDSDPSLYGRRPMRMPRRPPVKYEMSEDAKESMIELEKFEKRMKMLERDGGPDLTGARGAREAQPALI